MHCLDLHRFEHEYYLQYEEYKYRRIVIRYKFSRKDNFLYCN